MLESTILANNIINRFSSMGLSNATSYLNALAEEIQNYVLNNAEVRFNWLAYQTFPPVPIPPQDPITTANGKLFSINIHFTPSMANDRITALNHLKNEILQGFINATYTITDSGFAVSTGLLNTAPNYNSLHIEVFGNTQFDAMKKLCDCIINWIKSLTPTQTCNGTRTAGSIIYTGTANVIKIE
jgi:hypothetical protein